jgi:hypothetical protein
MNFIHLVQVAQLVLSAIKQGVQILGDAIGDRMGTSFPYKPEIITQAPELAGIINDYGVEPLAGPAEIEAVEVLGIPCVSSNCNNIVVKITQPGSNRALPDSLFIKLPSPSLVTRWFFNIIESWKLESYFFRHVAHTLPIRTPKTYAVVTRGTRFCLVQEDLNADPDVQLFTNFDMLQGPSIERVRQCLDTFAKMHATHYDLSEAERTALLPLDYHPFFGKNMRVLSRALNKVALGPCRRRVPGVISDELAQVYQKTLANWDAMVEHWFAGNLSLCHGDSHLGNFFVSGDEMGMLDFQATHWGNGIRDVQYFLIDSLPADILAEHERELVNYYVQRRAVHGTALDFETSWEQYRSFTYHTWMTIVVSIGLAAMSEEQDGLMAEILRRSVAAIERVDYPGWLEDYLGSTH